jgi:hypothetical protein
MLRENAMDIKYVKTNMTSQTITMTLLNTSIFPDFYDEKISGILTIGSL